MRRLLASAAFLLCAPSAPAQFALAGGGASASTANLVAEVETIAPGQPFTVALQLQHPPKWHSYYKNSGGIEKSPEITWQLPPGFSAGPIQWPVPEIKATDYGKSMIYPGTPVFLVEITPAKDIPPGQTMTLSARANWQICDKTCKDEAKDFTLQLPVAESSSPAAGQAALFSEARKKIPGVNRDWEVSLHKEGGGLSLSFTPRSAAAEDLRTFDYNFIPDQPFVAAGIDPAAVKKNGDSWVVPLESVTEDLLGNVIPQGDAVSGILVSTNPAFPPVTLSTAPAVPAVAPPAPPASAVDFLMIVGLMMLGGLVLNLMPCVFPVIGLKIMGFVEQAGADHRKVMLHGVSFTGGVLVSFAGLSGILFAARAAGGAAADKGWGYQLQNPWVVLALMLLMFVLALNMFGLFEIGASATSIGGSLQSKQGLGGSFFSGLLATVVATPCSGPFLGAAIGKAVVLPGPQFFAAFAAMGIGLSLPYLLLSAFPELIKVLPRPGRWMESFKQGMSFLLFATTAFLLWVYAGQIGLENLLGPLFGLSAIGLAAWIYGRWNLPHLKKSTRFTAVILALVLSAGGVLAAKPPKPSAITWETWSQEAVAAHLAEGRPVYVDFTAQWCATCQVNKKVAYSQEVIDLIGKKKIVMLKADKTKPDAKIDAKLAELNRTAIPVNVLYVPGGKEPVITPEVLTPGILTKLFAERIP